MSTYVLPATQLPAVRRQARVLEPGDRVPEVGQPVLCRRLAKFGAYLLLRRTSRGSGEEFYDFRRRRWTDTYQLHIHLNLGDFLEDEGQARRAWEEETAFWVLGR